MKQKLKSEETQNAILESAFSLFYRNGYNSTTIPEIVKETGLTKGAFYHHFKDKKEVGEKTMRYILKTRIYKGMIGPLKGEHGEATVPFLVNLFTKRIKGFPNEEKKLGCPLNNLVNEVGYSDDVFRRILKEIIEEWKMALIELLEKGKLMGEIRSDVDPLSTATFLVSAFEGARGIAKLYENGSLLDDYLDGVVAYIHQLE